MNIYSKKSLDELKNRIDLIEVISPIVDLKKVGACYKGLCPFHDESTPSFIVRVGDSHYHCFGCGAHGDAIAFLREYQKWSFQEAVESLADKFSITLELEEGSNLTKQKCTTHLKESLEKMAKWYHYYLLHSDEGHEALKYLYARGIDLDFIRLFGVGYAPKSFDLSIRAMKELSINMESAKEVGLLQASGMRPFFSERVMFPIQDKRGIVIGYSGRKIREESFGPKYLNTKETTLFKKAKVLFGLHHSRKRIAKEQRVLIVEGQIDALRLIQEGFNFTVASQGTAFGEEQVREITQLGVTQVYLALDADKAGQDACFKIGNMFQKEGVEVFALPLPNEMDPDELLREIGPEEFAKLFSPESLRGNDYLHFLVKYFSKGIDMNSPSKKNHVIQNIALVIRKWDHPLMIHESLRKLAQITSVPENLIGVEKNASAPNIHIKKSGSISSLAIDPDRLLEMDLLRLLFLITQEQKELVLIVQKNLAPKDFTTPICKRFFIHYFELFEEGVLPELFSLLSSLNNPEERLFFSEIIQKKVNEEKIEEILFETIKKITERNWMNQREEIRQKIQSGRLSEDEILILAKKFDDIRKSPPTPNFSKV